MAWPTAQSIINKVAVDLGVLSSSPESLGDPWDSEDQAVLQLCALLEDVGQELARGFMWTQLQSEYTFPTADGTSDYELPDDFLRLIQQTSQNRTASRRVFPITPQGWQAVQVSAATGVVERWMRIVGGGIKLYPTPTAIETVAFEYIAGNWCHHAGDPQVWDETPTAGANVLYFDPLILKAGLRLKYREANGFDTHAEAADYARILTLVRNGDGSAPLLALDGCGSQYWRDHFPESGWGV